MSSANSPTDPEDLHILIVQELESFLYTPYGVATLAALAILLTSLLWGIGFCVYCYHQRKGRHRHEDGGTIEASQEMDYYGMTSLSSNQQQGDRGTLSSGYNTGLTSYSPTSSSRDCIISTTNQP